MATVLTTTNSTITGNSSSGPGGGIEGIYRRHDDVDFADQHNRQREHRHRWWRNLRGWGRPHVDQRHRDWQLGDNERRRNRLGLRDAHLDQHDRGRQYTPTTASDIVGTVTGTYNLIGTGGAGGLTTGNHNQISVASPGLGTLGDYGGPTKTIPLLSGSPAIHAGTSTNAPSTDQRGLSVDSPTPDVGAFQVQSSYSLIVQSTSDSGAPAGEFDLRGAIDMANILNAAETITFEPSVFSTSQTITVSSTLNLTETAGSEVIDGPGASLVTVSGNNAVTVFSVASGVTSSFSGLTISGGLGGGSTGDNGGGIYNSGTTTVTNAIIEDNSAINAGGGIFNAAGTMTVNDCTIANNTAGGAFVAGGGGIYSGATMTITNSTIDNNVSHTYAGGIFDQGGTGLTVTNSTVAYNVASTDGGGIEIGGTTTLDNTVVALNTLGTGSGAAPNDVRIYQSGSLSSASAYNLIGTGGAADFDHGKPQSSRRRQSRTWDSRRLWRPDPNHPALAG